MSKVTSKLQITIPKAIADRYGIVPGDDLEWTAGADSVRLRRTEATKPRSDVRARIALFDAATERQRLREAAAPRSAAGGERGWTREELYERGRPD